MARSYSLEATDPVPQGFSGIDYRKSLNDEQFAAVTSSPGPALVLAGAGAGKTRTLTYRVAWLLDQGVDPWSILLLTFTNKAAKEMTTRVRELVPRDLSRLWSGTFHSVASRILRAHAPELGYTSSFTILDSDDARTMLRQLIKECSPDPKAGRFPKVELISSLFSLARNRNESVEDTLSVSYPYLEQHADTISEIGKKYRAKKRETNSMDFDDLLVNLVRLFRERDELRALYGRRFRHILVDEYQDTNTIQNELIDMLAQEHRQLMVVGDDAQSIYSWRGANPDNITGFEKRYTDARVFKITENYRSVSQILELANEAIAPNVNQVPKTLQSVRGTGEMIPAVVAANNPRIQAFFVRQRIQELLAGGIPASEIAVLYRAHYQSMELQLELNGKVPFCVTSGIRFFEQQHIKDVMAFMRFVLNPRDELSFSRMMMLLPGIGPGTAQKLYRRWAAVRGNEIESQPASFSDIMLKFPVPEKAKAAWDQLCYTLDELAPEGKPAAPSVMLQSICLAIYDDYMQNTFENYDQRAQDLSYLTGFADQFEDPVEFLAQLSLQSNTDGTGETDPSAITLSTIHQAKGLEWSVVFLIGLSDGQFPLQRAIDSGDPFDLEEERRLFYVAVTRAKDQLYLTYPRSQSRPQGMGFMLSPSRFLDEVPGNLLETWDLC